jgi:hypothetical protein
MVENQFRDGTYLVPVHKWPFPPNSSLLSEFNPRNIKNMPVVKFIERLNLEQNISFLDKHYLRILKSSDLFGLGNVEFVFNGNTDRKCRAGM